MTYRISHDADADLESIFDWIAQDNPAAAERLDDRIHQAIEMLARHPGMGHRRPDVRDGRYRFWAVGSYLEGKMLVVVRVLHGARNFRRHFRS